MNQDTMNPSGQAPGDNDSARAQSPVEPQQGSDEALLQETEEASPETVPFPEPSEAGEEPAGNEPAPQCQQEAPETTEGEPEPLPEPDGDPQHEPQDEKGHEPGPEPPHETETQPDKQTLSLEQRLAALEKRLEQREAEAEEIMREQSLRQHFGSLQSQAAELKRQLPDFSLEKELQDPRFLRLTSPEIGLGVEDAYFALHHKDLQAEAYERAVRAVGESVRSGALLPRENGAAAAGSPPSPPRSYRDMSPQERAVRRQLILSGHRF